MADFRSRYQKHTLVRQPASRSVVDGKVLSHPGRKIEFKDGLYSTHDKDEIAFLRQHPDFGICIFEETPAPAAAAARGRRAAGAEEQAGPGTAPGVPDGA